MKKTFRICAVVLGSLILIAAASYIALGYYYNPYFVYGTWINGIYCTGMSVQDANNALLKELPEYKLMIEEDGLKEQIYGSQIDYRVDYTKSLTDVKSRQNPLNWGYYVFHPVTEELQPEISYDQGKLQEITEQLSCYRLESINQDRKPRIIRNSKCYEMKDDRVMVIDQTKTTALIEHAIDQGMTELSLLDDDCYIEPKMSVSDKDLYTIWNQIDRAQKTCITYQDAALQLITDADDIAEWICKDQNGDFILEHGSITFDEDKIKDYTEKISDVFDSDGSVRTWTKENGEVITVHSKGKGYQVDCEAEEQELLKAAASGKVITRKPVYAKTGDPRTEINMGKTYIEVDMSAQKLYYYKNEQCIFESDIVTGNTSRGHGTPEAVCEIYYMQKNRTLHGADYESFVYYWMAVKGHIGIHDATWRDQFGGQIYKTAGSHGCINIPKEKAAKLYDMVEVGIPVIMYYRDK